MTASIPAAPTPPTHATATPASPAAADHREAMNKDIHERWNRFSTQDVSAIKNVDELVQKVSSKYGQDKTNARIEVDALLKGRTF